MEATNKLNNNINSSENFLIVLNTSFSGSIVAFRLCIFIRMYKVPAKDAIFRRMVGLASESKTNSSTYSEIIGIG